MAKQRCRQEARQPQARGASRARRSGNEGVFCDTRGERRSDHAADAATPMAGALSPFFRSFSSLSSLIFFISFAHFRFIFRRAVALLPPRKRLRDAAVSAAPHDFSRELLRVREKRPLPGVSVARREASRYARYTMRACVQR